MDSTTTSSFCCSVEMEPASPSVNTVLTGVGWVEAQLLRWVSLPVETSMIAVAEK